MGWDLGDPRGWEGGIWTSRKKIRVPGVFSDPGSGTHATGFRLDVTDLRIHYTIIITAKNDPHIPTTVPHPHEDLTQEIVSRYSIAHLMPA